MVDDNAAIHADFRKILSPASKADKVDELEAKLFGLSAPTRRSTADFELDSAFQGAEALQQVKSKLALRTSYALAFVDMRMPPGWDGVETVERIWRVQPDLKIVFCTAYSDYSWNEVVTRLGQSTLRLLIKPFSTSEVLSLAIELTQAWNNGPASSR